MRQILLEWQTLDEPTKRGLARAAKIAPQIIDSRWAAAGETTNGWKYTLVGWRAGYDPGLRAALAKYNVILRRYRVDDFLGGDAVCARRRKIVSRGREAHRNENDPLGRFDKHGQSEVACTNLHSQTNTRNIHGAFDVAGNPLQ